MKKRILLLGYASLLSIAVSAQKPSAELSTAEISEITKLKTERSIHLENQNSEEELVYTMKSDLQEFGFDINAATTSGEITIELYNSNKEKKGSFTIGTQFDSKTAEAVRAQFSKSIRNPDSGDWTVKIISENATGDIKIETRSRQ